jgi:hypothetical protein
MSIEPNATVIRPFVPLATLSEMLRTVLHGGTATPEAVSQWLSHDFRQRLDEAERALADVLPPVKASDARDLANHDRTLAGEIEAWRDRMFESADVSDMHRDALTRNESGDEEWEIVRGSSRFEVREVPRFEARPRPVMGDAWTWYVHDNELNEQTDGDESDYLDGSEERTRAYVQRLNEEATDYATVWIVVDTEDRNRNAVSGYNDARDGDGLSEVGREDYDVTDEEDAKAAAEAANVEDYRTNAAGWPWANNTGWKIDERDVEDFDAAGFVVARFDGGDLWAGIDGGGYSFTDAHWAPLYLKRAAANGWYVRTDAGLRRVVA